VRNNIVQPKPLGLKFWLVSVKIENYEFHGTFYSGGRQKPKGKQEKREMLFQLVTQSAIAITITYTD
jgi:hypothetical protein